MNVTIMFPGRSEDATRFGNIMYQNVQLSVDNVQFPDTKAYIIHARFYQMHLVAKKLDRRRFLVYINLP